jgi:hypothetical protein
MNQLDASMVDIGTYDAAYKIDLKQSVAREIFRFSVYNSTLVVDDLETNANTDSLPENSDRDVGFYVHSLKFPTASPNYTVGDYSGTVAAPLNPLLASTYVGHLAASTIEDNNVVTIAQEYMSHVAKSLFTTAKATAIFNNESDFIRRTANQTPVVEYYKRLYDMSGAAVVNGVHINTLSAAEITTDTGKDVSDGIDARSRNSLARNLFYSIAAKDITRVSGILDGSSNYDSVTRTYPIPVLAGDTFNSFVTIKKNEGQAVEIFGAGSTTAIPDRKYRIVLNIVADNVTPTYNLNFQRPTNFTQVSSWPIAGIEELRNTTDAVSLA